MTLAERFKLALEAKGMTQKTLADRLGVTKTAVNSWVKGRSLNVNSASLLKAAAILDVSANWLATGEGTMKSPSVQAIDDDDVLSDDYFVIPEYEIGFGASKDGNEEPNFIEMTHGAKAVYRRSFFEKQGVNPQDCKRFRVDGDSMSPYLFDGDLVTADCHPGQKIKDGQVYLFSYKHRIRVKKLSTGVNNEIIVESLNPKFSKEIIPEDAENDKSKNGFRIIGRVIDRSGALHL